MPLYDRMVAANGLEQLHVHVFAASLRELTRGNITKARLITDWNLDAGEQTELNGIIAKYNAQPTDIAKDRFAVGVEDALILAQAGFYTKAKVKAVLGF